MSGFTLRLKQTPSLRVDMRGVLPSADLRTMKVGYGNTRVPLAELFGYATELRSATQGRAVFTMRFDRFDAPA